MAAPQNIPSAWRGGAVTPMIKEMAAQTRPTRTNWEETMLPNADSYESLRDRFAWSVPQRYNIGVDVCDT